MKQPSRLSWPQAKYLATELSRKRSAADPDILTQTLQDARVDLNPHQVESALFALRKSTYSRGAILADEVGLGKTIEAGLILSQRWAEGQRRLLIICPANLRKQWAEELQDKFYLDSDILDTKALRKYKKDGMLNPYHQEKVLICSYEFARKYYQRLKQEPFDLIVLDEAHRLRNESNQTSQHLTEALEGRSKILLTATPLQNNLTELYVLSNFVDKYAFGGLEGFKEQYMGNEAEGNFPKLRERLQQFCHRTLRRQVLEYVRYTSRLPLLQEFTPNKEEQQLYELVNDFLAREELISIPSSQRALTTLVLRKLLASSSFAICSTLEGIISRLRTELRAGQRQLLDDTLADYEDLQTRIEEDDYEDSLDEGEEALTLEDVARAQEELDYLERCYDLAKSIKHNGKADCLVTALEQGFAKLAELGAQRKALIFTESRRTQEFLVKLLTQAGYGDELMTFDGSNDSPASKEILKAWKKRHKGTDRITGVATADMRAALVDYFREQATIMIATEAAAEGINLQFCSLVVNYDLPWNPQRVEQRIGRCHRYGQKHDVVVINFLNQANEADKRIYELLDQKFNLFKGVFGASDEVLGTLESGTDFERNIIEIYNTCRTEQEIQQGFDRLQARMSGQISERMENTRKTLLENFDEVVTKLLKDTELESQHLLGKYEETLWLLAEYGLSDYADFRRDNYSFRLREPIPAVAEAGRYEMTNRSEDSPTTEEVEGQTFRSNHPLAQWVIQRARNERTRQHEELVFDYTASGRNIFALKELVGKSGYISVDLNTITKVETTEQLAVSVIDNDGRPLHAEVIEKLWTLPSHMEAQRHAIPAAILEQLQFLLQTIREEAIQSASDNASTVLDEEIQKLDNWREDMELGLEREIQDLRKERQLLVVEARKQGAHLDKRMELEMKKKAIDNTIRQLQRELESKRDEIADRHEALINALFDSLQDKVETTNLFTLRWRIS